MRRRRCRGATGRAACDILTCYNFRLSKLQSARASDKTVRARLRVPSVFRFL
ncbi:hypothetical protein GSH05_14280 [Burkholderia pseudomallei]|uniref:Uncharacterized protein n=3 Tax=pseudomallei group TaxID=111527 RepID=A0AAX1X6A0_BURML|nr:hypothetical protein BMA1054 [Burkholderia mallei ATCC 23344]AUG21302.1 hypothetical protein CXQ84_12305 [Burkholderia pseudomallei]RKN96200.1 hypothetical protein D8O03_22150 [Burkholderia mallei]AYX27890.1 hypothetical protein EGY16_06835 [Burkholderia pseudomallei]AYX36260.1 hypothetical protein EGY15_14885 [Burkholderia pseudomallei]